MRLWSIDPQYLDAKGLVALWREALLAKHVLEGKTKGYINHPQLQRFKTLERPLDGINLYLEMVCKEAEKRNYHFNKGKIGPIQSEVSLSVTRGQLEYERKHLLGKLKNRDPGRYEALAGLTFFNAHPLFNVMDGGIESWEIL
jgi:hypothetical protein